MVVLLAGYAGARNVQLLIKKNSAFLSGELFTNYRSLNGVTRIPCLCA